MVFILNFLNKFNNLDLYLFNILNNLKILFIQKFI